MKSYELFLRHEAFESFKRLRGKKRQAVEAFLERLMNEPNSCGDYSRRDSTQRKIEVSIVAGHAVTFWADHAVREIKVVDIRSAGLHD